MVIHDRRWLSRQSDWRPGLPSQVVVGLLCHRQSSQSWPSVGNRRGLNCKDTMETVGRHIVVMGLVCSLVGKIAVSRREGLGQSSTPSSGSGFQSSPQGSWPMRKLVTKNKVDKASMK